MIVLGVSAQQPIPLILVIENTCLRHVSDVAFFPSSFHSSLLSVVFQPTLLIGCLLFKL
jgi:hypothetical protein